MAGALAVNAGLLQRTNQQKTNEQTNKRMTNEQAELRQMLRNSTATK
jgi:hypothetical protein